MKWEARCQFTQSTRGRAKGDYLTPWVLYFVQRSMGVRCKIDHIGEGFSGDYGRSSSRPASRSPLRNGGAASLRVDRFDSRSERPRLAGASAGAATPNRLAHRDPNTLADPGSCRLLDTAAYVGCIVGKRFPCDVLGRNTQRVRRTC